MNITEQLIRTYDLQKHPEGGYFKETYRSSESIGRNGLPNRFEGERSFSTGIYFLLESDDVSKYHRIKSDEMWHFYEGCSLTIHEINEAGEYKKHLLGRSMENGGCYQLVIPAGSWFGATVNDVNSYSFVGCTVAPGFDFTDFELADRKALLDRFPEYRETILRLT